jgi:TolA-binding protein
MKSRRKFLRTVVVLGVPAGLTTLTLGPQVCAQRRSPPQQPKDDDANGNAPKLDPKLILEANQKEMRKNVEKLYDLASELKAEVEKTDSVQVLSLSMVKKTEEIERLAKEIRNRAKG